MARVLVVEPNRQIRTFIAGILADFGHVVEQCRGPVEAEQCLQQANFDVIASDLVLARDAGGMAAVAQKVPVLTLCGQRFAMDAPPVDRPSRLPEMPFRVADLQKLLAAITEQAATSARLLAA